MLGVLPLLAPGHLLPAQGGSLHPARWAPQHLGSPLWVVKDRSLICSENSASKLGGSQAGAATALSAPLLWAHTLLVGAPDSCRQLKGRLGAGWRFSERPSRRSYLTLTVGERGGASLTPFPSQHCFLAVTGVNHQDKQQARGLPPQFVPTCWWSRVSVKTCVGEARRGGSQGWISSCVTPARPGRQERWLVLREP